MVFQKMDNIAIGFTVCSQIMMPDILTKAQNCVIIRATGTITAAAPCCVRIFVSSCRRQKGCVCYASEQSPRSNDLAALA